MIRGEIPANQQTRLNLPVLGPVEPWAYNGCLILAPRCVGASSHTSLQSIQYGGNV